MKKIIYLFILSLIFNFLLPSVSLADGGLIPPPNRYVYETDQRAVIFYENNIETLILSVKFQGNAEDFAWIIPTPNKPEVEKSNVELFSSLKELTQIQEDNRGVLLEYGFNSLGQSDALKHIEIIETKKIAYYDITVLRANDENALNEWLNENGYKFPSSGDYVLKDYIDNNWYFTAVKISGEYLSNNLNQATRNGDLIPLSLQFNTSKIVFPLKISSIDYYYEENEELDPYINRYKPIYNFLINNDYKTSLLPKTWENDASEIRKINTGLLNQINQDIRADKNYSLSIASVVDFMKEEKYNGLATAYKIQLKNYNEGHGEYPDLFSFVNAYFPNITQDAKELANLVNKKSSKQYSRNNPYIKLLIYIVADKVYDYPSFDILYADFIEKNQLKDLAIMDDGNSWIEPQRNKYTLTKLYRNMRQSEMSNDIYFQDSDIDLEDYKNDASNVSFYVFIIFTSIITLALVVFIIYFYKKKNNY